MLAVVIPCYKVKRHILDVLKGLPPEVARIYVVDDKCPEGTGDLVRSACADPRVKILHNEKNLGVGGAVIAGYRQALADGATVVVKMDGDGQMDPLLLHRLVEPIQKGRADYTKGNRFFTFESLESMPWARIFGNSIMSLCVKIASGYWNVMDPTNGYTAIHADALRALPLGKLDQRYFFESDMLFRLNTGRAVVKDVPIPARYGTETSNLKVIEVVWRFPGKLAKSFAKRIFYNYFLRDFNAGTVHLCLGVFLVTFGIVFGGGYWIKTFITHVPSTSGTVMLAALPLIIGSQLLIAFVNYDIGNIPTECIQGVPVLEKVL